MIFRNYISQSDQPSSCVLWPCQLVIATACRDGAGTCRPADMEAIHAVHRARAWSHGPHEKECARGLHAECTTVYCMSRPSSSQAFTKPAVRSAPVGLRTELERCYSALQCAVVAYRR